MKVFVVDYGMSNLGSVKRSFEECGAEVVISDNHKELKFATHIVLPGVGAFWKGMDNLRTYGWVDSIRKAILVDRIPFLGICLGMQLMASEGEEGGTVKGLGLISGKVIHLKQDFSKSRVPHVGWNEVSLVRENRLFCDIRNNSDFYFVHSYHFVPDNNKHIIATTPYCGGFVSGIAAENIFGVQFHPEKSSREGFQVIRNFIKL